ncbi:uncharacterized protein LOC125498737 [Beta vulgaris subsp. vulgaris]|uniref:uncharacterized protein LOC125498737 n=1 Tax=Beta vulgaris subsp. vulgaris TaxID=3555 RepID=UPI0020373DA2|nr:uncharacterized protein LOC125498737 [Beta vulgaris subsp. vulgaris]
MEYHYKLPISLRGRIWLLWDSSRMDVNIARASNQFIHVEVSHRSSGKKFWFTAIYGVNDAAGRQQLWRDLVDIKRGIQSAWIIGGDFNNVLNFDERIGSTISMDEVGPFRQCLRDCELHDVVCSGPFFTWSNKQEGVDRVFSKIDRVCVNEQWEDLFPDATSTFYTESISDHCPCVVKLDTKVLTKPRPFRFFNMWCQDDSFEDIVELGWQKRVYGVPMYRIVVKLKALKQNLKVLNRTKFSDVENEAERAAGELKRVQTQLHACPHDRTRDEKRTKVSSTIVNEGKILSSEQQAELCRRFNAEDVKVALFDIEDNKAPGPDGYTSCFYKRAWPIVGAEVTEAVLEFFQTGRLLKQVNATTLCLVPKCDQPNDVSQFRPIACCNVLYKIISKMLCARLKKILPTLISPNQSAFIEGRVIIHNIFLCQDIMKHYKRKNMNERCTIKVDLRKAYDSIQWEFIKELLQAMKFPEQFINWIMSCITTPSYSLSVNGGLCGFFEGKQGLRQGDPVSPLLFVIAMDYFSRLMARMGKKKEFQYHPRCRSLALYHLIFADDLMLFSKGDIQSTLLLRRALKAFADTSGLEASQHKTTIYFGSVDEEIQNRIVQLTGFQRGDFPFKYLGIPITTKKLKKNDCDLIVDKMLRRITS